MMAVLNYDNLLKPTYLYFENYHKSITLSSGFRQIFATFLKILKIRLKFGF